MTPTARACAREDRPGGRASHDFGKADSSTPNREPTFLLSLAFLLLFSSSIASNAAPAPADSDERRLAIGLAGEGRCAPALDVLARVQTDPPTDAEVARLDGVCALRLQDFRRAAASLEIARSIDPEAKDVDLYLGMAYYHGGRIDRAAQAMERARAREPERAEVMLYSGLVALGQKDYVGAADRLDAASQLSEAPVEPMASFFLGRARLGTEESDRAQAAFERVIENHPGTPWAEEAARALEEMRSGSGIEWWASAEVGLEVDDNALLRGRTVGLPGEISDQSDQRGFWFVDAGATLFEVRGVTGGGMLRYAGSEHVDLNDFDAQGGGGTVWLDGDLGIADASLRLQYDFDTVFIDYSTKHPDPFVMSHVVAASLYKPWEVGGYTILSSSFGVDDYGYERFDVADLSSTVPIDCTGLTYCGPPIDEEEATDRDGRGVSVSVLHNWPVPLEIRGFSAPWLEGEYRYQRYWSEGSEYDHDRHQVELGFGVKLPFEIGLRMSGRYAYSDYAHPSVFPDPSDVARATAAGAGTVYFLSGRDREEHETGLRVSLERAIGQHVVLTTRYSRTRNRSNADVFSYTRDLFGVSVRVGLGG